MNPLHIEPPWKPLFWYSVIGGLIYLLLQVGPSVLSENEFAANGQVIGKAQASQLAAQFIQEHYTVETLSAHALHQSNRSLNGYLSKEQLLEQYTDIYDANYPTDTYQVQVITPRLNSAGKETFYYVYVHMTNGNITAWNRVGTMLTGETKIEDEEQAVAAVKHFAATRGFHPEELTAQLPYDKDGFISLNVIGSKIKDAQLQLRIRPALTENGEIRILGYKPEFNVPAAYTAYVDRQDKFAAAMSLYGYFAFAAILFILSIIFASIYRQHSSFARGLVMTVTFLLFYILNNYNMADGIRAGFGEDPESAGLVSVALIVTVLLTVVMAASVYFALVAGDALWRSMGRTMWPRFGETGFGEHVWQSMKLSYLLAPVFLGIQTVIFLILQNSIGMWTTTDVTQSPYNFSAPWLFPMIAWCAAISEEAVFRLFGIGLLRKWFNNLFVASLIPSIIWALGHVTYPIYPAGTRLIELTIIGLLFSYIMIRWGFLTAVFTHAVFNTIMMSLMLIFLGTAVNIAAAIFYLVLPVIIAWIIRAWDVKKGRKPQATVPPSVLQ